MITPEQQKAIDQYKTSAGLSSAPAQNSAASRINARLAQPATPPVAPVPAPTPTVGQMDTEQLAGGVNKMKSAITEGADKYAAAPEQTPFDPAHPVKSVVDVAKKTGALLESGLGTTAGAIQTIFAPVTAVAQKAADITGVHPIDNFVNDPKNKDFVAKLNELAATHPEAAKNLGDALTVLTTAVGGTKGDVNIPTVEETNGAAANVLSDAQAGISKGKQFAEKRAATKTASALAENQKGVIGAIKENPENLTPTMKKEYADKGLQTITKGKNGTQQVAYGVPKEIEHASTVVTDAEKVGTKNVISPNDTPDVVLAKAKGGISRLGQKAEMHLEQNAQKITNTEHAQIFDAMKTKAEDALGESQLKAYDEQIKLFSKQLPKQMAKNGGGFDTANYYKALKQYESNVGDTLKAGKASLMDSEGIGAARLRAASDIRTAVRDMIGEKNPEFKPQMKDLMSLYETKDAALFNASKATNVSFSEANPKTAKALKYAAIAGGGAIIGPTAVGAVKAAL